MGIVAEEPVLSRLDRLDNMLRQLEEIRGSNNNSNYTKTPSPGRSSSASTPSSGTFTSTCTDGHRSSIDFSSPSFKSLEKYCRPIEHAIMETQVKGTLIQRLDQAEDRLSKLCVHLEEELEEEKKREAVHVEKKAHKKGLKQLVKQCVQGKYSQHKGMEWNGRAE